MKNSRLLSAQLASKYYDACIAELQAIKPGNVHIFADGHNMTVQDFMRSAEVSANPITNPASTVGERIFKSINATVDAVQCNTNLGMVLLVAPLTQAIVDFYAAPKNIGQDNKPNALDLLHLKLYLQAVLTNLTVDDAKLAAQAIQRANPAGLGRVTTHDINAPVEATLYMLMQAAAHRDMIAYQYTHNFTTILDEGLMLYNQALAQFQNPAWATTALYLSLLSATPDRHIARKYGQQTADSIMREAKFYCDSFWQASHPKSQFSALLKWDTALKNRHINPGTTADLTVATLFVSSVLTISANL